MTLQEIQQLLGDLQARAVQGNSSASGLLNQITGMIQAGGGVPTPQLMQQVSNLVQQNQGAIQQALSAPVANTAASSPEAQAMLNRAYGPGGYNEGQARPDQLAAARTMSPEQQALQTALGGSTSAKTNTVSNPRLGNTGVMNPQLNLSGQDVPKGASTQRIDPVTGSMNTGIMNPIRDLSGSQRGQIQTGTVDPAQWAANAQLAPAPTQPMAGSGDQLDFSRIIQQQAASPPPTSGPPSSGVPSGPAFQPGFAPPRTTGANDAGYGTFSPLDASGNVTGVAGLPQLDLPTPGLLPGQFSGQFSNDYFDLMNTIAGQIGQQFDYQMPQAQAAQMQLGGQGGVPQPSTSYFNTSPELASMLAGQGIDPATLAQMRSRAIEDASGAGRIQMGQAKRALEQGGLSQSPAGAAIAQDVARQTGQAQTSALRDIDIQNALLGLQNKQFGVGQQTNIGLNNMQAANTMALNNANRMFSAMSQNLANQQATNMAQFGAETGRQATRAGEVAQTLGQHAGAFQQASLGRQQTADETNLANQINFGLNQANLDRQRQQFNAGQQNQDYWNTANLMNGFPGNPAAFGAPQPGNSFIGAGLSQTGQAYLDPRNYQWGPQQRRTGNP